MNRNSVNIYSFWGKCWDWRYYVQIKAQNHNYTFVQTYWLVEEKLGMIFRIWNSLFVPQRGYVIDDIHTSSARFVPCIVAFYVKSVFFNKSASCHTFHHLWSVCLSFSSTLTSEISLLMINNAFSPPLDSAGYLQPPLSAWGFRLLSARNTKDLWAT